MNLCLKTRKKGINTPSVVVFFFFFLAVLGLHCCWTFPSSCSEWGPLSSCTARVSHCGGFSCFGAQAVGHGGSVVVAPRL